MATHLGAGAGQAIEVLLTVHKQCIIIDSGFEGRVYLRAPTFG